MTLERFRALCEKMYTALQRRFDVPGIARIEDIFVSFSPAGQLTVYVLSAILAVSCFAIFFQVNQHALIEVPAHGGSFSEGIVGSPRFVNPLLAATDADRDLTQLAYAGLMRANSRGDLIPDVAESYDISDDGLSYTFHIRENATFHNGTPLTADDVLFTISKAQDPTLKSPRRANWDGVGVEKIDDHTIAFHLKQPYSPFLENTTLGILPKNLWENITDDQFPFSQLNIEPVGSGPYVVTSVKRDSAGIPTTYTLSAFKKYSLGEPFISRITLRFYQSKGDELVAYRAGSIDGFSGVTPAELSSMKVSNARVEQTTLPEVFGLFFNQNQQPLFADQSVRLALSESLDRSALVETVFSGYASPLSSPIPPSIIPGLGDETAHADADSAAAVLLKGGWKKNADGILEKKTKKGTALLSFSIATANVPELRATAEHMKETWEKLGARVDVKIFEPGDLNQNVIRTRKYDALLFGEIVGRELDLYAFWHSSQRNDPGLNIAMYVNTKTDKVLEQLRQTEDPKKRIALYRQFEDTVASDVPAIFAYAPDFMYIVPDNVHGVSLGVITTPSERFLDVYRWYIESDRVWSFFL